MGFFPIDSETLAFLRRTGREAARIELVERYTKEQGLFLSEESRSQTTLTSWNWISRAYPPA